LKKKKIFLFEKQNPRMTLKSLKKTKNPRFKYYINIDAAVATVWVPNLTFSLQHHLKKSNIKQHYDSFGK